MRQTVLILLFAGLFGCNSTGPKTIPSARSNYNEAVVHSSDVQLLLNVVRQAYFDNQLMLEIDQINASYAFRTDAGVSASLTDVDGLTRSAAPGLGLARGSAFGPTGAPAGSTSGLGPKLGLSRSRANTDTDFLGGSFGISLSESPTVTYKPLRGSKFAGQLLLEIQPENIVQLSRSVWDMETLLLVSLDELGGRLNVPVDFALSQETLGQPYIEYIEKRYEDFLRVVLAVNTLESYGVLRIRNLKPSPAVTNSVKTTTVESDLVTKEVIATTAIKPSLPASTEIAIVPSLAYAATNHGNEESDAGRALNSLFDAFGYDDDRKRSAWNKIRESAGDPAKAAGTLAIPEQLTFRFFDRSSAEVQQFIEEPAPDDSNASLEDPTDSEYESAGEESPLATSYSNSTLGQTRSLLGILQFLSQCVETPERKRDHGYWLPGRTGLVRLAELLEKTTKFENDAEPGYLFRIQSSDGKPSDAAVKVQYRHTWYYIDDQDGQSKRVFNLLSNLVQLQSIDLPSTTVNTISLGAN